MNYCFELILFFPLKKYKFCLGLKQELLLFGDSY